MSEAQNKLNAVVDALREGGYDPYAQIFGYMKTGDDTLITRRNGARDMIKTIDRDYLERYVELNAPVKTGQ